MPGILSGHITSTGSGSSRPRGPSANISPKERVEEIADAAAGLDLTVLERCTVNGTDGRCGRLGLQYDQHQRCSSQQSSTAESMTYSTDAFSSASLEPTVSQWNTLTVQTTT